MLDFNNNLLKCTDKFWRLEHGMEEKLTRINQNKNIQTLYSQTYPSHTESYLEICYTEAIEIYILRYFIPELIIALKNDKGHGFPHEQYEFLYLFREPEIRDDISNASMNLGCLNDPQYFNINRIRFILESQDMHKHEIFWNFLVTKLSTIVPT